MPRLDKKSNHPLTQNYLGMEVEESNQHDGEIEIDVNNIQNEVIESSTGFIYSPDQLPKCFIPQNDLAKELTLITLKIFLIRVKIKASMPKIKIKYSDELYIVNKNWYNKWKKYSKYDTVKRAIIAFSTYSLNPIKYTPNEKLNPGIINNKDLYIKNKIDNKDEKRNLLISKSNNAYDTKEPIILLPRDVFNLLKDYFKCDMVLKLDKIGDYDIKNYDDYSVHLNLIFIPTLDKFKEVTDENYEDFLKKYNIIYDTYFKQNSRGDEIEAELRSVIKERPELLSSMGVKFVTENNEDELMNHLNFLKYYIPHESNTKSPKEILDYILSKESIEKVKNNTKISSDDIPLNKKPSWVYKINEIFHIQYGKKKNNIDQLDNGLILIEYIPCDKSDDEEKYSIFDEGKYSAPLTHYESPAYRESDGPSPSPHSQKIYRKDYNLDDFPLNEKENKNGLVGLNNLGNTCYMNTGIQCLSNCELLTKYFLGKYYQEFINKDNPIGSKGEIVEKYSQLIQHLWYGNEEYVSPIQFKNAFGKMYTAFNNSRQQDTQEFISYLLDSLHEDLNKVLKKPYIEEKDLPSDLPDEEYFKIKKDIYLCRNQSFITDLISGFYKSTLYCPDKKCKNIAKRFELFNMITLSLINEVELRKIEEFKEEENKKLGIKELTVTFIPFKINFKPLLFHVKIKKDTDIFTFKKKIEIITKFNLNTFEIYKIQGNEYVPLKNDVYLMEEFLKGEKKIYLFQIPPYVFGKKLDFFDKTYMKLISDMDSFFLEEEKYEGNDLYKEYNKKEKKAKTEDDLDLKKNNRKNKIEMEIEGNENKIHEEKKGNESDEKLKNEIIINIKKNTNNTTDDLELKSNKLQKLEEDEDTEMEDVTFHMDKSEWVKAELYNYSYEIKEGKNKSLSKEERIARPRIIYINKKWNNAEFYDCILNILNGAKINMNEIKEMWYKDLKDITINLDQINKSKSINLYDEFNKLNAHPLMVQYMRYYNFIKENIMKKGDKHENSIFIYDQEKYEIKDILDSAEKKGNSIDEVEILFKLIWRKELAEEYKEGIQPKILEKSEKLEDILKIQREDEYLKKNNMKKSEEDSKNKKNKKMNLDELLTNFSQIEKLSKDNEWYCPKCKKFQLADKKMEIYSISEVVIIHLKRFRNNRKIENHVEFPIEGLDLTKYLPKKEEKYIYDLFAVANHSGGLQGGHYYAYCKNVKDGEWYEFNDSHVSKINKKKVCSDNAYVLFYNRKRDEKINEEELFKKPFIEIDCSKYKSN